MSETLARARSDHRKWPGHDQAPLVLGAPSEGELTDHLLAPVTHTPSWWWPALLLTGGGGAAFVAAFAYSVLTGVGLWGNNIPNAWAFPIINFVWWIGIGHAGTFISAFLLLLEQRWRSSINRIAEAMTLFALVLAGLFPVLHLGRSWFFYWLVPYPNTMGVWPQFKSTLPWDVAAISTYFIVSAIFFYVGLLPDLATARDASLSRRSRLVYGFFALGWRGSGQQWRQHRAIYLLLAGLATPLVVSVHSIVSLDFSISQLPGWHSTIFPPYFVVGAIYSGLAMVLVILLPVRRIYHLYGLVTERHLESVAKLMLACAWILAYSYVVETFLAWYSGAEFERHMLVSFRPFGHYAWVYWLMLSMNVFAPQIFWWRRMRLNRIALFSIGLLVLAGMWIERFIIVVTSESQDFLPSSWANFAPTWVDWTLLLGSVSLFAFLYLLFLRFVPPVPIAESKRLAREKARGEVW